MLSTENYLEYIWQFVISVSCLKDGISPFTQTITHLCTPWQKQQNYGQQRQQRHLHIFEFSTEIAHVSRKNNIVTDCVSSSRTTNPFSMGIDYIAMARAQAASIDVEDSLHLPRDYQYKIERARTRACV